jgi:flavin-dependent dehydrogenase
VAAQTVIVGAGLAGLATAIHLAAAGRDVVVVGAGAGRGYPSPSPRDRG